VTKQKMHFRRSKRGKKFIAGRKVMVQEGIPMLKKKIPHSLLTGKTKNFNFYVYGSKYYVTRRK